jgi:hypothetical protein
MRIRAAPLIFLLTVCLPFAAEAQTCVPDPTSDWMGSMPLHQSSAGVRPSDCATVQQTPPDFSWPDLSADAQYQVTLTYPDGHTKSVAAPQNWINWDEVLPAGSYLWQVQATNASGTQLSRSRRFTVDAGAVPFLVPDWTVLFERATAKARPRAFPDSATWQEMLSQRQTEFDALIARVDRELAAPLQTEPTATDIGTVSAQTSAACGRAVDAALAWLVTGREEHFADALRRLENLASWNPRGSTSYAAVDQASSEIAATLTLGYDWLFPGLSATQRDLLLSSILARGTEMYDDLMGNGPRAALHVHPYDSHRNVTLTSLAGMSTALAGDLPEAQAWLRDTLPFALSWTSPWGGEDGGFGNGTAYAHWSVGPQLLPWYALRWTVGVDIAQKVWVRNYARYLAYFLPPGTPSGAFGDGAEMELRENWGRYGKGYTLFAPSPLGRWYAAQLGGGDLLRPELLLAPPADSSPAPYPEGTPDGAFFPSIGWTAMHSSLADPARVSVYFKSSPYGSYNHSHADQNSFVVNAGGRALAIDSGHFDAYDSPHWRQWYKQTRAHNAITYDGGQGQVVFEESGNLGSGWITGYVQRPDYDIVFGDATPAYGGALTEAKRSLVYLRPNLILVYDRLASDVPRQWEWNIHALNAMTVISDRRIAIHNDNQSLCVDMLAGPTMRFAQTDVFTVAPIGDLPRQWHGNFHSVELLGATEFVALLDVGCQAIGASASKTDGVWTVPVGDYAVTIAADGGITVSDTSPPTVSITSPAPGSFVSGTITVQATATDSVGVAGVQFQYAPGGTVAGVDQSSNVGAELVTSPYRVSGDTNSVADGQYVLTAVARDAAGNRTTSAPVTITVDNSAPTVSITSHEPGATVFGTITVTANASDNIGVAGVQFQYDGINVGAENTAGPYSVTGDTTTVPNGTYTLTAVARDAAGNRTVSAPISITVANP